MKKTIILFVCLLMSAAVLAMARAGFAQSDDGFDAFVEKFRAAVIKGDKETVVGLSRYPIRMPGRGRNIKSPADLRLRYRQIFNKYANAPECFAEKYKDPRFPESNNQYIGPVRDSENPKLGRFFCGDNTGYGVNYWLELTKTGWKFVRVDRFILQD
jgi:hypothetical protein